ncbi:MAG: IS110 family transposase [Candidatus Polarisedimenticolaceae bacterium]|nr:IS110 family transposase [Candidatus Polarisedimenticolaceae bacterium]
MKKTIVGVDLAKKVIQVCVVQGNKVVSNDEMSPVQFTSWLAMAKPAIIVFESCATSNYWMQVAKEKGHDARIISAKLVSQIRQNQKTDKNDALAIVQASQLIDIKFINGKSFKQQELQSIMRMRELAVKHKVALRNQIEALLLEFNIRISSRNGGLGGMIQGVLEDAENGFCTPFREALSSTWNRYLQTVEEIAEKDKLLDQAIQLHPECKKLLALEGVSTINAVNLYIAIGCEEAGTFKTGRDASACIGLTPLQHSSGGKTKLGSIGKSRKNVALRSYLVNGAMSVIHSISRREARTKKEQWLKQLLERKSKKCVAVALANKTVRTAFALLTQGTEYKAEPIVA